MIYRKTRKIPGDARENIKIIKIIFFKYGIIAEDLERLLINFLWITDPSTHTPFSNKKIAKVDLRNNHG